MPTPNSQVTEDPSPNKFKRQAITVAIVLIVLGVIALIIGKVIVGGIIAVLGAVFGLGSQVVRDLPKE